MITDIDVTAQVITAVTAGDGPYDFDVDAIAGEIMVRYGLVDIDATDEDGEQVIGHDEFWAIVARHDLAETGAVVWGLSAEQTEFLATLVAGNAGRSVTRDGARTVLSGLAVYDLARLGDVISRTEGTSVLWIGGVSYPVTAR